MRADAVFEGGGVKAIALVGALAVAEERYGYRWVNVAGTSAGAIVACLVAAGYSASELTRVLRDLNYAAFCDKDLLDRIPLVGPVLSLGLEKGIYEGDALEAWLRERLAAKGVRTFGDLILDEFRDDDRYRFRLRVIASDLTRGRLLALPQDIRVYGIAPEQLDVARAVRMSASLPFFFEPVALRYRGGAGGETVSYIVDGGVLSNFPVWLFDSDGEPSWPTIGFKLVEPGSGRPRDIRGPLSMLAALVATMLEAHDARYIESADWVRTIPIPTLGVRTTDFGLTPEARDRLYHAGAEVAERFFKSWDFDAYVREYRHQEPPRGRRLRDKFRGG